MKKILTFLSCVLTVFAAAMPFVASAAVIDQNTASALGDFNDYGADINYVGLYRLQLAQPFSVGASSANVGSVTLHYSGTIGSPAGNATVSIWTDSGGNPGTMIGSAASGNPPSQVLTDNGVDTTFNLCSAGVSLSAMTTYYLVYSENNFSDQSIFYWNETGTYGSHALQNDGTLLVPVWDNTGSGFSFEVDDDSTCGGGGGGGGGSGTSTPPEATSSPDQAQENLFNAYIIFFVSFYGMVWLMRKH